MVSWGNTTDRILLLLEKRPLTKHEICHQLGLKHDQVASVLTRLRKPSKAFGQRIYIYDYTRTVTNGKTYLRAIYALGAEPDAERPRPYTSREKQNRSYHSIMTKLKTNSIFNLGKTRKELYEQRRVLLNNNTRESPNQ